jgi:hypothetical protein
MAAPEAEDYAEQFAHALDSVSKSLLTLDDDAEMRKDRWKTW